jgi:hypothetical protein
MLTFTSSKVVGYQFAHEAVLWLYENYNGFEIGQIGYLRRFLETDALNLGVSLAPAQSLLLHRLALRIDLAESTSSILASLAQITNRQLRHGFTLSLTFHNISSRAHGPGVYSLALALEALQPVVTNLENNHKAKVNIYLAQKHYDTFDIKHMLGPWNFGR